MKFFKNGNRRDTWLRGGFILGVLLLLVGSLDPLEGSVLILAGSLLLAVVSSLIHDPHSRWYLLAALMILFGVTALWILSALGGFGGENGLDYARGLWILPYPLGWLLLLLLFYLRLFVQKKDR